MKIFHLLYLINCFLKKALYQWEKKHFLFSCWEKILSARWFRRAYSFYFSLIEIGRTKLSAQYILISVLLRRCQWEFSTKKRKNKWRIYVRVDMRIQFVTSFLFSFLIIHVKRTWYHNHERRTQENNVTIVGVIVWEGMRHSLRQ
jgi:hypothetical protein